MVRRDSARAEPASAGFEMLLATTFQVVVRGHPRFSSAGFSLLPNGLSAGLQPVEKPG
jgi:hypothetical protein